LMFFGLFELFVSVFILFTSGNYLIRKKKDKKSLMFGHSLNFGRNWGMQGLTLYVKDDWKGIL